MKVAGHIGAARAAAMRGDQQGAQRQMEAMTDDYRRAIRLPDPARPIPPEPARVAAKTVAGVSSAVWLDRGNLFLMVQGPEYRNQATIDQVCLLLEPMGDTLGVTVNLQDATATTLHGQQTLSRNCQLRPGERALMDRPRRVDVVDPQVLARTPDIGRATDASKV